MQHTEGRSTPGLKMSSRPRVGIKSGAITPGMTRSPPLTTSQFDNTPHPPAIIPKEGSMKIRSKSSTPPEAKSRRATRGKAGVPVVPPVPSTPAAYRTPVPSGLRYGGSLVPASDSEGSLAEAWMGGQAASGSQSKISFDRPEEKLEASEAVLVTVRSVFRLRVRQVADCRVRPPNELEQSRDSSDSSVWDTPSWDHHLIKLGKGRDGNRDEREWVFGETYILIQMEVTKAKYRSYSTTRDRQCQSIHHFSARSRSL